MGIISQQAARNSLSILLGTVVGAVNTIVVLPQAFAAFPEGWGLLKVLLSWAMIFAQFLGFGAWNNFVRFSPNRSPALLKQINGFILLLPAVGMAVLGAAFLISGESLIALVNESDAELLRGKLGLLFVLTVVITFTLALSGRLSAALRSTWYQFLNEFGLKALYLLMSLVYLVGSISFDALVQLYVGSYVLVFLLVLIQSLRTGLEIGRPLKGPLRREILHYGLYSVLDKGASVMVNNLDIIMISLMLDLENVAYYTLAFYMGSVVLIPQKSLLMIGNPIAAKAIAEGDDQALYTVYRKSALTQLLLGGLLFCVIWVNIDSIFSLLPPRFSGGKWVVLFIGLSKLFYLGSGINAAMIVYSSHYRVNLYLSSFLVGLTVLSNWLLIPQYGIEGAALATLLSLFLYHSGKTIFVQRVFKMHPFSREFMLAALFIGLSSLGGYYWDWSALDPLSAIIGKGLFFAALMGGACLWLSEDIRNMLNGLLRKYFS